MDLCELRKFDTGVRHPWETARLAIVGRILERGGVAGGGRLLDIGCGDGFVVEALRARLGLTAAVGLDPFLTDDELALLQSRRPTVDFVREMPTAGDFDVATLLDVLEHVEDDLALLAGTAARVRKTGKILIAVPAHPHLFTSHDTFMNHYRRYSGRALNRLIADAGLEPLAGGSLFLSLAAVRSLQAVGEQLFGAPTEPKGLAGWRGGVGLSRAVSGFLTMEGNTMTALAGCHLPIPGLSLWALCQHKQ